MSCMIVPTTRTVYFVPGKGRHYLSKSAAVSAAAKALIEARHPTEKNYTEPDGYTHGGWHWSSLPRSDVLFRRVRRLVLTATPKGGA